ncbi:hypothetical protein [Halohasta litchfieldiae]|uniref:hypothetical protein n=1 Tax=Halohasta litchfieldiae TaxID=1073996 RepID=UPI001FE0EC6D|nr:hypothetical protein [Halohasta litchfieldiae]
MGQRTLGERFDDEHEQRRVRPDRPEFGRVRTDFDRRLRGGRFDIGPNLVE